MTEPWQSFLHQESVYWFIGFPTFPTIRHCESNCCFVDLVLQYFWDFLVADETGHFAQGRCYPCKLWVSGTWFSPCLFLVRFLPALFSTSLILLPILHLTHTEQGHLQIAIPMVGVCQLLMPIHPLL